MGIEAVPRRAHRGLVIVDLLPLEEGLRAALEDVLCAHPGRRGIDGSQISGLPAIVFSVHRKNEFRVT